MSNIFVGRNANMNVRGNTSDGVQQSTGHYGGLNQFGEPISPNREIIMTGMVDEMQMSYIMATIRSINTFDKQMEEEYTDAYSRAMENLYMVSLDEENLPSSTLEGRVGLEVKPYLVKPIILRIKTGGGYIDEGLALYNVIRESKTPIIAIVHYAYSMGTILTLACDEVFAYPESKFMIHDGACGMGGKFTNMERAIENWKKYTRPILKSIYLKKSLITEEHFEEIMERGEDRFYNAREMLELGIIDGVLAYSDNGTESITEDEVVNKNISRHNGVSISELTSIEVPRKYSFIPVVGKEEVEPQVQINEVIENIKEEIEKEKAQNVETPKEEAPKKKTPKKEDK